MPDRPEIVCLCGSLRFAAEMAVAHLDLSLAGAIVLAPALPAQPAQGGRAEELSDEQRAALGELHLRRIDLADRVVVVNPGGYVGESTSREIDYARAAGTPVSFSDPA